MGIELWKCVEAMPGGRGYIVGLTYLQIMTKFLPPMTKFWKKMGLKPYDEKTDEGHYIIGKKPPEHWDKPIQEISNYKNAICWCNGTVIELLSMDRPGLNLGGNFDFGAVDEVQNINEEKLNKDYIIATRSTDFPNNPKANTILMAGTMPWSQAGQWIFKYEELAKQNPNEYLFLCRPSTDNIANLGKPYYRNLKRILSPLMYAIEIENYRVKMLSGGFYPSFNEDIHTYYNSYEYSDKMPTLSKLSSFVATSTDYDPAKDLCISFDFGAKVTAMIVAQEQGDKLRVIDMFAANENTINADPDAPKHLLQNVLSGFTKAYGKHKKVVEIYGDHTGHNRTDKSETSYAIVEASLRKAGLTIINKVTTKHNPAHSKKYYIINQILAETNAQCPKLRINLNTCKDLILSIQVSPVLDDYQKDKRSERRADLLPSQQTHYSDALDYLLVSKYGHLFPLNDSGGAQLRFRH